MIPGNEKKSPFKEALLWLVRVSAVVTPLVIIFYLVRRLFN